MLHSTMHGIPICFTSKRTKPAMMRSVLCTCTCRPCSSKGERSGTARAAAAGGGRRLCVPVHAAALQPAAAVRIGGGAPWRRRLARAAVRDHGPP